MSAAEVEMTLVQDTTPEKLARAPARPELSGGNAIEQLPDGPPFAPGNAGVKRHVLWPQSRFAPHSLHTVSVSTGASPCHGEGGSGQTHGHPKDLAPELL